MVLLRFCISETEIDAFWDKLTLTYRKPSCKVLWEIPWKVSSKLSHSEDLALKLALLFNSVKKQSFVSD